jgi:transposase
MDEQTLRDLYETQRLTSRDIGERFGTSKTQILRLLRRYGIPIRPQGRGLANRGVRMPSREELHDLVHVQCLPQREIAQRCGVDQTMIHHWLDRYEIPRSTMFAARRATLDLPDAETLGALYEAGESLVGIGARYDTTAEVIRALCVEYGIPVRHGGWKVGVRYECADGHLVRSVYEQRIDDWLHDHGVPHQYEPRLPFAPRSSADFLANCWYIEIWGVTHSALYEERKAAKIAVYAAHQVPLIQIPSSAFKARAKGRWMRLLAPTLR